MSGSNLLTNNIQPSLLKYAEENETEYVIMYHVYHVYQLSVVLYAVQL
jgi:hypothetical protein